ncbi:hypothetical protein CJ739_2550 [Mariniflexile rhizosphaerae]|uniref:hypothetical protein n=1 Tax=unclassified Mariniflexile TaxID=2643887 RepID=UPI000E336106|nr:hypothetical protein [Mariniflexile sp. TRM1-10]AXP81623.1 hypothetical protein CJ739_2550 [Mariniflexile sp. TRM1-10]
MIIPSNTEKPTNKLKQGVFKIKQEFEPNNNTIEMSVVTSPKIKKSAIVLISVGLLNFIHGMLHVIQFLQSMVLIAYATERTSHHSESILDSILHHPILAFLWAIIGLLTFLIGIKDFRHHRKCGNGHKHSHK